MDDDDLFELCGLTPRDIDDISDDEPEDRVIKVAPSEIEERGTASELTPPRQLPPPPTPPTIPTKSLKTPNLSVVKAISKSEVSAAEAAQFLLPQRGAAWALANARESCCDDLAGLDAFCLDGVLTNEECDALVAAAENSGHLSFWSSDRSAASFRNADTIEMTHPSFAAEVWARVEPFLEAQSAKVLDISEEGTPLRWERDIGGTWDACGTNECLLVSRYEAGGHFAPHTDGYSVVDLNHRSMYSMIVYLNDCCTPGPGDGGTRFFADEAKGKLRQATTEAAAAGPSRPEVVAKEEKGEDESEGGKDTCSRIDAKNAGDGDSSGGSDGSGSGETAASSGGRFTADLDLEVCTVSARKGRVLVFYHNHMHEGTPPAPGHSKYIVRSDLMFSRRDPICTGERDREAYSLYREAVDLAGVRGCEAEALPLFRRAFAMSRELSDLYGI
jgi:hypothetical protein